MQFLQGRYYEAAVLDCSCSCLIHQQCRTPDGAAAAVVHFVSKYAAQLLLEDLLMRAMTGVVLRSSS
eukprot:18457-Heterococcus_DN1.PRE.3